MEIARHVGPMQLDEGATFTQKVADRVFIETGVRAVYRARTIA